MSKIYISILALLLLSISFAQETESKNPIAQLNQFINQVSSSEEHLLHQEKVGPYIVNADGQRLVEHPYLKFDITKDGVPLSDEATVMMESVLYTNGQSPVRHTYTAVSENNLFVIDPLDLTAIVEADNTDGGWMKFDLIISDGEIEERRGFDLDYYSPRPDVGFLFRFLNTMIPLSVLVLAFVIFRFRGLRRNQVVPTAV